MRALLIVATVLIAAFVVAQNQPVRAGSCGDACDASFASCKKGCKESDTDCFTKCLNERGDCLAKCS